MMFSQMHFQIKKLVNYFLNMLKFFISFSCVDKLFHKRLALNLTHLTPRKELTQDKWRSLADLVVCVWISPLRVKKIAKIAGNFLL